VENLLFLLRDSGAMLEGHFLLSSGRHSDKYFQCAKLLQYPDRAASALAPVAEKIKQLIQTGNLKIDAIVGPAMGGIVAAYELGRQLGLPAFFTERAPSLEITPSPKGTPSKEGADSGKMVLRRGFEVLPGQKILITEDVVTTGKSSGECAAALEELGAEIAALACLVDRRQPGIDIPWPFFPACRIEAVTWDAGNCELCKKGIPVVKPGSRK
jgi:orotate phosphoribosyltransferase